MNKKTKIILAGVVMGFLWGIIQVPFSLSGISECRNRSFFGIMNDGLIQGFFHSPIIAPIFAPTTISMAIACSTLSLGYGSSLYNFFSIVLPPTLGCLLGGLIGIAISKFVK